MYRVITPETDQQLEQYFDFRWQMLKKPFGLPIGAEKDEYDSLAQHRMIIDSNDEIVAVTRLHLSASDEVQIRHTAVHPDHQRRGLGSMLMTTMEDVAKSMSVKRVVLFARKEVIEFYQKCGYQLSNEVPAEESGIERRQMIKILQDRPLFLRHPRWCQELQNTWDREIPVAHIMGIKVYQFTGYLLETRAALNANLNLHGTMFAGSIYSLATLTGWGMLYLMMKEQDLAGDIVLGDGNIHYHKPITNLPRALCHLSSVDGSLKNLQQQKKARLKLKVSILDGDKAVAEFYGTYVILPRDPDQQPDAQQNQLPF